MSRTRPDTVFNRYYELTKPGIIYGNALPTFAGYILASGRNIDVASLLGVLIGQSLVIASGCIANNMMDRKLDRSMARTKTRALVTGLISMRTAALFSGITALLGFTLLLVLTNSTTFIIGLVGWLSYVFVYGYFKRRTPYGTLIGSFPGALPPVAGYTAVTGRIDLAAVLLFLILAVWQVPHFYAIAQYRLADYRATGLPVWPVIYGPKSTRRHILGYITVLILSCLALFLSGFAGYVFLIIALIVCTRWFMLARVHSQGTPEVWAKKVFLWSLVTLLGLCAGITLDSLIAG